MNFFFKTTWLNHLEKLWIFQKHFVNFEIHLIFKEIKRKLILENAFEKFLLFSEIAGAIYKTEVSKKFNVDRGRDLIKHKHRGRDEV